MAALSQFAALGQITDALRVFWVWWSDQLLGLLPGHAERLAAREDDGVILSEPAHGSTEVIVIERQHGVEQPPTRLSLTPDAVEAARLAAGRRRLPFVLRLPGGLLLERAVALPIVAERDLARVLFHEMDRLTPFTAAEVFWSWQVLARDRAHGKLQLTLSLVPRLPVEPILARLRDSGLPVAELELAAPDGERRRIALDHAASGDPGERGLLPFALAGLAVLAAIAVAMPFVMQARAMSAVERRIAAYAPTVSRVQQLRRNAASSTTGAEVIAAQRRRGGDALEALALLTAALPDNTYLTALTFDAGKLTMDGQSQSAAALIAPLTANQRLQDASFTAPVVRNTLGADTFSMRLRVTR